MPNAHADILLHGLTVLTVYSTTNMLYGVSFKFYELERQEIWCEA